MIKLIKTAIEYQELKTKFNGTLGFVPTMGNLHEGHLSLLKKSLEENDQTIISIFVNPKQFAPGEDYLKYPRTLEDDSDKIKSLMRDFPSKTCWVLAPQSVEDVYPLDFTTSIRNETLGSILEGLIRPSHFEGVLTVVYQLFALIKPNRAYFGLKDYQQYIVIKQMIKDLALPIHILGMPIVRDSSGLALSSRNQYLTQNEREEALLIPKSIMQIADLLKKNKDINMARHLAKEITSQDARWNYLEIRDSESLDTNIKNKTVVILGAMKIGQTRLIDNLLLEIN